MNSDKCQNCPDMILMLNPVGEFHLAPHCLAGAFTVPISERCKCPKTQIEDEVKPAKPGPFKMGTAINSFVYDKPAPRERVITISKCQDCKEYECELRGHYTGIPDACPLPDHKQYVRKALLDAYHLEHQSRNYKTNKE